MIPCFPPTSAFPLLSPQATAVMATPRRGRSICAECCVAGVVYVEGGRRKDISTCLGVTLFRLISCVCVCIVFIRVCTELQDNERWRHWLAVVFKVGKENVCCTSNVRIKRKKRLFQLTFIISLNSVSFSNVQQSKIMSGGRYYLECWKNCWIFSKVKNVVLKGKNGAISTYIHCVSFWNRFAIMWS